MATQQSGRFGRSLDRYDGLAGALVLAILVVAFLLVMQPILGLCVAAGVLSTHEALRRDTVEHGAVVAALWAVFLGSWWLLTTPQVAAVGGLAVVAYLAWRARR